MNLTATQQIIISGAADQEMLNANNYGSNSHKDHELVSPSNLYLLCQELNIETSQAHQIAHNVRNNYENILLDAIDEGYSNEFLTPDTIAYLQRKASRQPQL